ncbi:hypothetical protein CAEBREN_05438 [Caenorhabditis brenneri]|uniref:Uncharacterized protein n=1 Tax=Caenorhabditis brenneri TaxID=135651 RepID=G0MWK9_CAEBE|nr:hypothetical protein CAEBREN_05438 [Caenorhabditis brenneri]
MPFVPLSAGMPPIENSHLTISLLFGMIQTGLFMIFFDMMQLNFGWGLKYSRTMSALFFICAIWRLVAPESILIPKRPLKIHWKSIILINLFFIATGFYMLPYTTRWNMMQHYYVFLLCVEASIWYYTEEFRLFCRRPLDDVCLYHKAYYITVYRKIRTP